MSRPAAFAMLFTMCGCVPAEREHGEGSAPGGAGPVRVAKGEHAERGTPVASAALAAAASAESPLPVLSALFRDDFERKLLGDDYLATGAQYRIDGGKLCVKGAKNHPLWLRHRLPLNARVQVDAETSGGEGDIKLEGWGDGQGAATRISYSDATSYLAIFGGWKNRYHALARMDEHAPDRQQIVIAPGSDDPREQPVQQNRRYRLKLERSDGRTVRFWVDDVELLSLTDSSPLSGVGHDHFAFNDWEAPVCFDNLRVEPLPS